MSSVADHIRVAKSLISTPETWCQGALQRIGGSGRQYCAVGALWFVGALPEHRPLTGFEARRACWYLNEAARLVSDGHYSTAESLNDCEDHDMVMRMYDAAIALAEEDEK